ncbi:MliC family protein [Methylopila musalis]|uniref:MliC family protein n=1 Tax=Methylopila musalis TaxID=1134781 RepID=A0ABW3Z7P1_9HYPH
MRRPLACLGLAAALALPGCASAPEAPSPRPAPTAAAEDTRYACDDGSFLQVTFRDESAHVVMADGETADLGQQRAASGVWYASERYELRGKGDVATWSERGRPAASCLATRR